MTCTKRLARSGAVLVAAALVLALCVLGAALAPQKAWAYGFTQSAATDKTATITWDDPNADTDSYTTVGYTVSWGAEYGKVTRSVQLDPSQRSYTVTGLKPGTKYYAKVEYRERSSYSGNENTYTIGSGDIASRVVAPTGIEQTKWWYYAKSVEFTWDRQDAADEVEYRVCKDGSKKVFKEDSLTYPPTEFSVSKVSNNVVYTVQIRVHDQWGWSAWSKKAYLFTQPMVKDKKTKVVGKSLLISWDKIKGATGYDVYVSLKEKKGYKKVASVKASKGSVTVKKLGKKAKINPKKKYYVYVVAKKKVGKDVYTSGRHYTYAVKGKTGSLRWTFD